MPIRPSLRWFYPIDWPQLSAAIRFGRAKGRCERCQRPHGRTIQCLPDGQWFDADANHWRDGHGRPCAAPRGPQLDALRLTRVVTAAAHLDHDPGHDQAAPTATDRW